MKPGQFHLLFAILHIVDVDRNLSAGEFKLPLPILKIVAIALDLQGYELLLLFAVLKVVLVDPDLKFGNLNLLCLHSALEDEQHLIFGNAVILLGLDFQYPSGNTGLHPQGVCGLDYSGKRNAAAERLGFGN